MNDGAGNDGAGNDREGTIRDRAYAIWQEEGQPEGQHADHWHRAESEMTTSSAAPVEDPTAGVDASGVPTEDSAPATSAASTKSADAGPLTKIKKKTAKVVKSL